jgi:hypothetical protein
MRPSSLENRGKSPILVQTPFACRATLMIDLDSAELLEPFDESLEAVEGGQRFRIFRNGRPIAVFAATADRTSPPVATRPSVV